MNTFFKTLTIAIDIMMAICLGLEIKDRLAQKKNMSNDNDTVADPEPVTTE